MRRSQNDAVIVVNLLNSNLKVWHKPQKSKQKMASWVTGIVNVQKQTDGKLPAFWCCYCCFFFFVCNLVKGIQWMFIIIRMIYESNIFTIHTSPTFLFCCCFLFFYFNHLNNENICADKIFDIWWNYKTFVSGFISWSMASYDLFKNHLSNTNKIKEKKEWLEENIFRFIIIIIIIVHIILCSFIATSHSISSKLLGENICVINFNRVMMLFYSIFLFFLLCSFFFIIDIFVVRKTINAISDSFDRSIVLLILLVPSARPN